MRATPLTRTGPVRSTRSTPRADSLTACRRFRTLNQNGPNPGGRSRRPCRPRQTNPARPTQPPLRPTRTLTHQTPERKAHPAQSSHTASRPIPTESTAEKTAAHGSQLALADGAGEQAPHRAVVGSPVWRSHATVRPRSPVPVRPSPWCRAPGRPAGARCQSSKRNSQRQGRPIERATADPAWTGPHVSTQ